MLISPAAQAYLKEISQAQQVPGIRISVTSGGCNGMKYGITWAESVDPQDKVFGEPGAQVFIDPKSYLFLKDVDLDYEEFHGFIIMNLGKSRCGCGKSFA